jgi:SWI/SNF-related matrix-associated actin-dependent regulator of chromatin subfamily A3
MSAKRRQEAIARFSVPLEGISSLETTAAPRRSSRKLRNAEATASDNDSDDSDSDFAMDDDANDNLSDDTGSSSLSTRKKTKGKGKVSDENPRVMLLSLKAVR